MRRVVPIKQCSSQGTLAYHEGILQIANGQSPRSSHTIFQPVAVSAGTNNSRGLLKDDRVRGMCMKRAYIRKAGYRTYLTVLISFPNFIRMPSSISLTGLRGFSTRSQTEDVWYNISCTGCTPLGFHPQRDLHVGLTFSIRVILWILSQALRKNPGFNKRV